MVKRGYSQGRSDFIGILDGRFEHPCSASVPEPLIGGLASRRTCGAGRESAPYLRIKIALEQIARAHHIGCAYVQPVRFVMHKSVAQLQRRFDVLPRRTT